MTPFPPNPDFERGKFLEKLDASELLLSEWEQSFVASYIGAGNRSSWFTPGRRDAADRMRMKFGHEPEIKMPLFANARPAPTPEAVPGGCEFLKREDGRQQPCNAPAVWRRQSGFRYCEECADSVRENLRRQGRKINLVRIA